MKTAAYMTVAAIVMKLLLFLLDIPQQQMALFTIFSYLFIVLIGTFFAVRKHRMSEIPTTVSADVKAGMRTTSLFALLVSVFVLVYYNYIDTHYFSNLIADRISLASEQAKSDPAIDMENVRKTAELFFNPRVHATITLLGLIVTGAIYSLLVSLMMRRMPGFGKKA